MGSDGLIDMLMVVIQPEYLAVGHKGEVEAGSINGDNGKGVETIELRILGLYILADDDGILGTDSVRTFGIDAGLDGDDHAGLERNGAAEAVRALVDVEQIADAVTGAAAVVDAELPYGITGKDIELLAADSLFEFYGGKSDNSLEHERKIPALLIGNLTHCNGSGGIGCAGQVLSAAVIEQEMRLFDDPCILGSGGVVHHGGIVAVGDNCGEAVALKAGLRGTEGVELFGELPFCIAASVLHLLFKPSVELCFGDSVIQVGAEGVFNLDIVFACLHKGNGVKLVDDLEVSILACCFKEREVRFGLVADNGLGSINSFEVIEYGFIAAKLNAVYKKLGTDFLGYSAAVGIEDGGILTQEGIGDDDGIADYIVCTDIEEPCDIVKPADDKGIRTERPYLLANLSELIGC